MVRWRADFVHGVFAVVVLAASMAAVQVTPGSAGAAGAAAVAVNAPAVAASAPDCGPNPDGLSECDFYIKDSNGDPQLAGSNSASPTTLTSTPTTLTQTATNHLVPDAGNGMGTVTLNTVGGPITSYSPHESADMTVAIYNNIITWSTTGNPFSAGATFEVSSTEHANGSGTLGLGASWGSTSGNGFSYGPPITEIQSDTPIAAFSINPNTKVPGQFQFVSDSTDPDGGALTQDWTLGDGATAFGPGVTHNYTNPGTYSVTLKVTNAGGKSDQVTHEVVVVAPTLSASLAFVDTTGALLPSVSPQIGDTVRVRLTLSASDDGVGAVNGIGFTGDPLTFTPDNLTSVTGPVPPIPAPLSLQPGASTSHIYTVTALASGVVHMTSTPFGVDAVGEPVTAQPAQLSFSISSIEVTVSIDPPKFTESQSAAGTKPTDVTVTVTVKNISADPITNLNVRSLTAVRTSVGQLLSVAYKSGVNPDPTSGYPLGITLQPGAIAPPIQAVFTVQSDGKIAFQSLVTAASPGGATLRGFGSAILTVKPTYYLEFSSRVVNPGAGLLPAGTPITITGTVHNLTSSDKLDVGPLYARLAGNAGLQGLAYNGVGVDPKLLAVPGALALGPGQTTTFTLKVLTSYSDPTGAGGLKRSGGTSAQVTFTPWATVTEPDGTQFPAVGSEVLSTVADLTHRISIDDSIPIPETSYRVLAGGLMVGGAEGVWNAASGLVTGLIQLPNVAASGLLAVTNYQATVWDSFTDAQKKQFADSTASLIVPVLEANIGLAAQGSANLFNQASAFTLQYFTTMENDWHVGNYAQTVQSYSSMSTNAFAQLAIPVGLGKLASSSEGLTAVEEAQAALQGKLADLAAGIDSAETMEQIAPLLTEISNGTQLDPAQVTKLFGITASELDELQKLATDFRYLLTVRSRAPSSIDWLEKFQALVKPEAIKIKSVSELDTKLDYAAKYEGSLIFKEPVPLIELRQNGGQISDLVQAYVKRKGFVPGTPEYDNAINRVALRIGEWNKYAKTYQQWDKQGWVDVSFNWKGNAMADPVLVDRGKFVGFRLRPTGVNGEYVVEMFNGEVGRFVPVTGDVDPIAFTHLDGTQLDPVEHAALLDRMRSDPLLRAQHGESASYVDGGIDFIQSQFKPNEAALQIAPGGAAPRIVRINTRQSVWTSATDYRLVWDGGNDYAGSSPPYGGETLNIDYGPLGAAETPAVPGIPRALPGAGVPNVGRCTMTYSSSAASLPLIMGADGTLQQVGSAGDTTSSFESVCFAAGPLVNVSIRPSTTVATSILAGTIEIPVQAGPSVAGINDSTGFAAGQQVTVGAGTPGAEIGTISGFGSIILSAPLRNAHPADDVIVETEPAPAPAPAPASTPASLTTASSATGGGSGQTLPRTGSSPMPSLAAALLLLSVGGLLVRLSRRRRLLQMADEDHRRFGPQGEVIGG